MSTEERERLERLVEAVLHRDDDRPVDVPGARADLVHQLDRHRRIQRRTVVAVAASVLAVVVATSLLMGLRDDTRSLPLPVTRVTLAPSGLPVGLLEGKVQRSTGRIEVSNVRMRVYPDGTGALAPGGGTGGEGDNSGGYEVAFERLGPSRVAVRYDGPICPSHYAFTMTFSVRGRTVTVLDAQSKGCIISAGLAHDLAGTRFHVLPLPSGG